MQMQEAQNKENKQYSPNRNKYGDRRKSHFQMAYSRSEDEDSVDEMDSNSKSISKSEKISGAYKSKLDILKVSEEERSLNSRDSILKCSNGKNKKKNTKISY